MQPHTLTGFDNNQSAYQEMRALYTFFSLEQGRVESVGQKGLPLFVPMSVFASGKGSLKTLSQPNLKDDGFTGVLALPLQYACLYLNEILYRLLPSDDAHTAIWQSYYQSLHLFFNEKQVCQALTISQNQLMRLLLRRFEMVLFSELGALWEWADCHGEPISAGGQYRFVVEMGFVPVVAHALPVAEQAMCLSGADILRMAELANWLMGGVDTWQTHTQADSQSDNQAASQTNSQALSKSLSKTLDETTLKHLGQVHRQQMDYLLEYRPLHSRKLWQDHALLKR